MKLQILGFYAQNKFFLALSVSLLDENDLTGGKHDSHSASSCASSPTGQKPLLFW